MLGPVFGPGLWPGAWHRRVLAEGDGVVGECGEAAVGGEEEALPSEEVEAEVYAPADVIGALHGVELLVDNADGDTLVFGERAENRSFTGTGGLRAPGIGSRPGRA